MLLYFKNLKNNTIDFKEIETYAVTFISTPRRSIFVPNLHSKCLTPRDNKRSNKITESQMCRWIFLNMNPLTERD